MHPALLRNILIILGFSVLIVFILQRMKLPSILGFLLTGIVIGPFGLSLISATEQVETISEIGIISLLFVIGMELSVQQLISIKKTALIGGLLQVGLTILITAAIFLGLHYSWNEAVFTGFLFSLSSTAIVLKVFQDRNEISSPHGRNVLAILIFQDIIVVPMMLFTPIIAGQSTNLVVSLTSLFLKSVLVVVITIIGAKYIVPKLMHAIAKTRSKELFLLTTISICLAVAFLTSESGLSLALGAFLSGLVISESEYSHQATSIILPFKELFTSFFFISVGMLLDLDFFFRNIGFVLLMTLVVIVVKSTIASIPIIILKYPPRTVLLTGLSLSQVGEFAFILSKTGTEYNLLQPITYQYFLAVSIVSMLLTPFVIQFSEIISFSMSKVQMLGEKSRMTLDQSMPVLSHSQDLSNHLVIIGYGINGSNLAKAARYGNIPYVVVELNAETVRKEKMREIPILFGDAANRHIIEEVNVSKARAVVIAISDPMATKTIIGNIRSVSKSVYLLVRTRFVKETSELIALGADDVIPEEFETSIQIFSRVLHNFLIPSEDIEHFTETIRSDNYELFKGWVNLPKTYRPTQIPEFNITCLRINTDSGKVAGRSLKELNLRTEYGVTVLAISREGKLVYHVSPEEKLLQGDVLYVNGTPINIENFHRLIA